MQKQAFSPLLGDLPPIPVRSISVPAWIFPYVVYQIEKADAHFPCIGLVLFLFSSFLFVIFFDDFVNMHENSVKLFLRQPIQQGIRFLHGQVILFHRIRPSASRSAYICALLFFHAFPANINTFSWLILLISIRNIYIFQFIVHIFICLHWH